MNSQPLFNQYKFRPDVTISKQELDELFSLVKLAPSAFNLRHAHYAAVTESRLKEQVYEAAFKQYKVLSSSAAIVVLGDLEAYRNAGPINEGLLNLGIIDQREFDETVKGIHAMYEGKGEQFKRMRLSATPVYRRCCSC